MAAETSTASNKSQDYSQWTTAELIERVTALETQLREQTAKYAKQPPPPRFVKNAKKPPKPFDPSKYSTRHIALKFAYLGARYNGFEHHANNVTPRPTVEEELWKALRKTKLIFPTFRPGQSEAEVCWDGCEYSKCGRTDRGVSAFGQVIGLRVRSSRPQEKPSNQVEANGHEGSEIEEEEEEPARPWHHVHDELPYIQLLNRTLPPDIRVLAWCANPPDSFSARFNCKERRYRYFFTNPAYMPQPPLGVKRAAGEDGWLDIEKMRRAARKFVGLHDFRNMCKVDPSKQITNFERRIFSAGIYEADSEHGAGVFLGHPPFSLASQSPSTAAASSTKPTLQVYYFEVRGSAFLWHQVRHMVAILFLIGQGLESPNLVDELLDIEKTPAKPLYEMAADVPLVLWDCIFPQLSDDADQSYRNPSAKHEGGYEDAIDWIYVGDQSASEPPKSTHALTSSMQDRKFGRLGVMEDLWALWHKRKIHEVLASSLLNAVAAQGRATGSVDLDDGKIREKDFSVRVFDGSETPRNAGTYVAILQRERTETPAVLNARYAVRKGLDLSAAAGKNGDESPSG